MYLRIAQFIIIFVFNINYILPQTYGKIIFQVKSTAYLEMQFPQLNLKAIISKNY